MKRLSLAVLAALMFLPAAPQASSPMDAVPAINVAGFPWWVVRKEGHPILLEAAWTIALPNTKFGQLLGGTSSVAIDTTHLFWGGTGSGGMLTDTTPGDGAEIKATIAPVARCGDRVAFEMKWSHLFAQATTKYQFGLESRTNATIYQARFQASCSGGSSSCTWLFENGADTYVDFNTLPGSPPSAVTESPAFNASTGTPVGWARVVIDPCTRTYISFEIPNLTSGGTSTYDMHTVPLTQNGAASRALYLPFTYTITQSANAEPAWTTDWAVSIIPAGWPGGGGVSMPGYPF
jgi:hypothetical protein